MSPSQVPTTDSPTMTTRALKHRSSTRNQKKQNRNAISRPITRESERRRSTRLDNWLHSLLCTRQVGCQTSGRVKLAKNKAAVATDAAEWQGIDSAVCREVASQARATLDAYHVTPPLLKE